MAALLRVAQEMREVSSQYRGVHWNKLQQKWISRARHNGAERLIGKFDSEKAAAIAFDKKCIELRGLNAETNLPLTNYLELLSAHLSFCNCHTELPYPCFQTIRTFSIRNACNACITLGMLVLEGYRTLLCTASWCLDMPGRGCPGSLSASVPGRG